MHLAGKPQNLKISNTLLNKRKLQWHYNTGNHWGIDEATGNQCLGCGPQETFRGCADIRIVDSDSTPLDNNNQKMKDSRSIFNRICTAVAPYDNIEEVNQWCQENCPTGNQLSCLDIASLPHKMITSCIQIIQVTVLRAIVSVWTMKMSNPAKKKKKTQRKTTSLIHEIILRQSSDKRSANKATTRSCLRL